MFVSNEGVVTWNIVDNYSPTTVANFMIDRAEPRKSYRKIPGQITGKWPRNFLIVYRLRRYYTYIVLSFNYAYTFSTLSKSMNRAGLDYYRANAPFRYSDKARQSPNEMQLAWSTYRSVYEYFRRRRRRVDRTQNIAYRFINTAREFVPINISRPINEFAARPSEKCVRREPFGIRCIHRDRRQRGRRETAKFYDTRRIDEHRHVYGNISKVVPNRLISIRWDVFHRNCFRSASRRFANLRCLHVPLSGSWRRIESRRHLG